MLHLFIINPFATKVRGRVNELTNKIKSCMESYKEFEYEIHVTRWSRDAVGFVRRYVSSTDKIVRVHSVGGSGTLYEVVNGVVGLPNAEVAACPFGSSNDFIQYFKRKNMKYFCNLDSQIKSKTIPIDVLSNGTNYGVSNFLAGMEAEAYIAGSAFGRAVKVTSDLWPKIAAAFRLFSRKRPGHQYKILLDENNDVTGKYVSIMTANAPCYRKKLNPAVDAHPNDGYIDVYTTKSVNRWKYIKAIPAYTKGHYDKMPELFTHYQCKKIQIECDKIMHTSFDGEILFANKVEFSILQGAIKFVVPDEIDLTTIPEKYQG